MSVYVGGISAILFAIYVLQMHSLFVVLAAVFLAFLLYRSLLPSFSKLGRTLEAQKFFVSTVEHELRGPMSAMQIESEAALLNTSPVQLFDKKSKELIGAINADLDGLRQMSNIIKNLSLLASQEYSAETPEFKRVDLGAVLERLCAVTAKEHAKEKSIKLRVENSASAYVLGNESALEQIIMNLLKNAIYYSPRNTTVVASVVREGAAGGVSLSIRDQGHGIPEQDLPFVMDPFYRARFSPALMHAKNAQKGSGLGLAVVAALAKQHKAAITIASVLSSGTTVTLRFPAVPQVA